MTTEERRPIPSAPGYLAGSDGSIHSQINWRGNADRLLSPQMHNDGYLAVHIIADGRRKRRKVHQLVCEAFNGARPTGCQVRHLNGDRIDNRASNLAWGTISENAKDRTLHGTERGAENGRAYAIKTSATLKSGYVEGRIRPMLGESNGQARLTEEQVREIRTKRDSGVKLSILAADYGVSENVICRIAKRKAWAWVEEGNV